MIDSFQRRFIKELKKGFSPGNLDCLENAVEAITSTKESGGKVVVVTGSGPNLHEGVTTLIAELIHKGIVDGVTTSSAVIAHEMAGVLDRVKRVNGRDAGFSPEVLPHGGHFELSLVSDEQLGSLEKDINLDWGLIDTLRNLPGDEIIKAAGNMGYPMGLWIERLSEEILSICRAAGLSFEEAVSEGADPRTMLGAGFENGVPVLVTVPQLVGGGSVGISVGDSIPVRERCERIAGMMDSADLIIESAVALTQEIHDGPFETYTGHGVWESWRKGSTYSLAGKKLIRIDLDPVLTEAWKSQRDDDSVQQAINRGLPKTKLLNVPFRMEMSGFARLEGSIPVCSDIGKAWPVIALEVSENLGIDLDFVSFPQESEYGKVMRNWIADEINPVVRNRIKLIDD
jgi:hypothetical protein